MTNRAQRIVPRHLSFNLEDFPEMEGEGEDHGGNARKSQTSGGLDNVTLVTPGGTRGGGREELNLIGALETPATLVSEGSGAPHVVVPVAVLQNIMASQESLAHLVSDLRTQAKGDEGATGKDNNRKQWASPIMQHDDAPVMQTELRRLLQTERGSPNTLFEPEPPLTDEVLSTPYPAGYQPSSFRKFDGTGSAREHLMCFLDDLGVYRDNKSLRLKEFSKSLAGRAFTWYAKLRPGSIRSWEELATELCGKFLEEEGALHIMDLGRVKQKGGESIISFIKHYRDRALQCKETLLEVDLVYGCIKNIEDGSQIFFRLGGITTFVELMRRGTDVDEAMKRQGSGPRRQIALLTCARWRIKGVKGVSEALNPQREWLKDGTIQLKGNRTPLTKEQYDDPLYCVLHKMRYHTTMDCWTVRRTFQRQLKVGKILLSEEGGDIGDLHRRRLPDHGVNAITAASKEIQIEEVKEDDDNEEMLLSIGLAKTRGFRVLFSQLGLDQEAQKEAIRALTRIVKERG
ncbi:Retrotransposon gag domain [Sesbania bispinosa]|nr:Retrotransposon gag domain [Sesbania bispinosa]